MEITLSLEKTSSTNLSIVVDVFRASTSITIALNKFKQIIPTFTPEEAKEIAKQKNGVLAGERMGKTIEGFDVGNSPVDISNLNTEKETLVLTTSNGTRILKDMKSTVLIGSFINAKSVAKTSLKIAKKNSYEHIDIVMAGWKGNFAIEDFLASGEILHWIWKELSKENNKNVENGFKYENNNDFKISEYGQAAILASRNYENLKKVIANTRSSKRLKELGYEKDIEFSLQKNIIENVVIYENGSLKLLK
ncbi:2-phosphosulfolactate phosphatase [Candidatus Methanobinarius endosymbioticus]|uniref:2-phosphosulfolactate phosphatase n=1 Tax=Candidatus Methanobinarius endosymbioticus TaxID=2006182 RepID=A0A366M7V4_9EURY|nr:2-phosphosulfolactate phosphatase [Candidatus Methanobinarius endosymbioticus]